MRNRDLCQISGKLQMNRLFYRRFCRKSRFHRQKCGDFEDMGHVFNYILSSLFDWRRKSRLHTWIQVIHSYGYRWFLRLPRLRLSPTLNAEVLICFQEAFLTESNFLKYNNSVDFLLSIKNWPLSRSQKTIIITSVSPNRPCLIDFRRPQV